jgi:hypothetical protein
MKEFFRDFFFRVKFEVKPLEEKFICSSSQDEDGKIKNFGMGVRRQIFSLSKGFTKYLTSL